MKGGSQTRLGADISMADLLTPKYKIRVGSWNVRTLYQAGKLQQVLREMTNYKVEILCVREARWTDSGRRNLASGHTIFYSGRTDNIHRSGVAVIVTRKVEKTLYWNGQLVCLDTSSRTLYWNGQLVWTPALGLYTGMDN